MAQRVLRDKAARSIPIIVQNTDIDQQYPEWARRNNPIVRRHLGPYWKTLLPDLGLIVRLFTVQAAFVAVSYVLPLLFTVLMPTVTVSLVLLPAAALIYLQVLASVAIMSTTSIVSERRNETLPLLLIIPRPLMQVLYSKLAAVIWRQIENLGLIWLAVVLFSMPLLIIQYDVVFSLEDNPILMRGALILAQCAALIRVFLEPIMVGALGLLMGATLWARIPAIVGTVLLASGYFFALNLLRLLPLDPALRLFVETILPLIAPILITLVALRLTAWALQRD